MHRASVRPERQRRRLRRAGAAWAATALLVGAGGWLVHVSDIALVRSSRRTPWIGAPDRPTAASIRAPRGRPPVREFRRSFDLGPEPSGPAAVELWALRGFELELNGRRLVERPAEGRWRKRHRVDLAEALVPGVNELRVRVWNPRGPALLALRGRAGALDLSTRDGWRVAAAGEPERAAVRADDTRRAPSAYLVPRLGEVLIAHRVALALILLLCAVTSAALRSARASPRDRWLPLGLWPGIALFWGALLATKAVRLPAYMGFDGPDHLAYVRFLLERGSLPLAVDGPMMYHPPLFYALSALLLAPFGGDAALDGDAARVLLRLIPMASGLVQVGVAYQLARMLFPSDAALSALAALVATLLPMNLYLACYLSNEGLHAALAALAILGAAKLLHARGLPWRHLLATGALLGLAILTKLTSLILVPLVALFVALKGVAADRQGLGAALLRAGAVVAAAGLVSGGFFARNWLLLGQPVVGNWNIPGSEFTWWQYPGFHTPDYYLQFGAVLVRPFLASYESFLDGIYSTFWGDGLIGGIALWRNRHPLWNYDFMAIAYALALPATALWIGGFGSLAARGLCSRDLRRKLTLGFLMATVVTAGLTTAALTLVHPAYGMTKAFYALFAAGPLCVAAAHALIEGHRFLEARQPWLAVLFDGWAAALAVVIGLAFLG